MPLAPNSGEPDPATLFKAIGQALSIWEVLELQFAILHTIFTGKPREIDAMQQYGFENRTSEARLCAVEIAAQSYFQRLCDQAVEGDFSALVADVRLAKQDRHRIAHGLVQPIAVASRADADEDGWIGIGNRIHYYLGAPWYSTTALKMSFAEMDGAMIDERAHVFARLVDRATDLANRLSP